jgi:hypothetical protein
MAGLGKKTFVAGDVLTANDTNGFLMDQTVMNFANSAARSSAIPSPSEGMVTYLQDSNNVEVYDGSSFVLTGGQKQIASASLSGSSVTVSSIPAGYKDLIIEVFGWRSNQITNLNLRFNGDSTNNYGFANPPAESAITISGTQSNNIPSSYTRLRVPNYTNSNPRLIWDAAYYNLEFGLSFYVSDRLLRFYQGTAPITSITLIPGSGNFNSGIVTISGVK